MVSSVLKEAKKSGAAIVGVPVKATIKKVKSQKSEVKSRPVVEKTLNRDSLWEVQTPQVFKKELIMEAYNKFGNSEVTDDASLLEKIGVRVKIVRGSYFNIKITTPEDLVLAEAIAKYLAFSRQSSVIS
jgi:2-C-methyl-D-erythritol 4-phosphate cytidylyltransferase